MHEFLKQIIQSKQQEVNLLKQQALTMPEYSTKKLTSEATVTHTHQLAMELEQPTLTVIAEIKRHSPNKGFLASIHHPGELAQQYVLGGAKAISVLTDYDYFHGNSDDLKQVRQALDRRISVLRKDFIIDPIQLVESVLMGANVVLLIAGILKKRLREFIEKVSMLGLEAIVEIHNDEELDLAIESGATIIGINNRNLNNFEVSLDVAFDLVQSIPHGIFAIAESGISHPSQARLYHQAGFSGVLIGEALVLEKNPIRFIQSCLEG